MQQFQLVSLVQSIPCIATTLLMISGTCVYWFLPYNPIVVTVTQTITHWGFFMSRIPSYLQLNRYGIYHFRLRLPLPLIEQFGRTEFNKSLRTSNRREAIHLAQGIKYKLDKIFRIIQERKVNIKVAINRY